MPVSSVLGRQKLVRPRTPDTAGECDEDAERLRIVLCTCTDFESLDDPDHDHQYDDLANGADGERNVRHAVPSE